MRLRVATIEDAARLMRLGSTTFSQAFRHMNNPADFDAYVSHAFALDTISAELRDKRSIFVLAFTDTLPAGYFKLSADIGPACVKARPAMEIARFYSLKKFWGRGVGDIMMKACLDLARQKGAAAAWLSSWKKNDRGNAFYKKWGFKIVGEKTFQVGTDVQKDHILVRGLSH